MTALPCLHPSGRDRADDRTREDGAGPVLPDGTQQKGKTLMSRKKIEEPSVSASSQLLAMTESRDRLSKLLTITSWDDGGAEKLKLTEAFGGGEVTKIKGEHHRPLMNLY